MIKILITGKGSYIGTKLQEWLEKFPGQYSVDILNMVGDEWERFDFTKYDCVYHVAGIVHRKNAPEELYENVNHILAVKVAEKAQDAGVKQFIFLSSGAVYKQSGKYYRNISVDEFTDLKPNTIYGISKVRAEQDLKKMQTDINIAFVRPPMVYGPGAKGNYNTLKKLAIKFPIFPNINNQRSMIYIDNLCEFVRLLIESGNGGVYLPQNRKYVNTTDLVKQIAKANGHKILTTRFFNWAVYLFSYVLNPVNKVFGSYTYKRIPYFDDRYQIVDFETSILRTEQ